MIRFHVLSTLILHIYKKMVPGGGFDQIFSLIRDKEGTKYSTVIRRPQGARRPFDFQKNSPPTEHVFFGAK